MEKSASERSVAPGAGNIAVAYRNRAFISYSQADKLEARRVHKWLETYRLPKGLATASPDRRLGRIFRDETDLGGASDLAVTLKAEIDASECLIVLCSPSAARSKWVDREIQHFRSTGRGDRIFAVILSGSPNSSDPDTECYPPAFRLAESLPHDVMPAEPLGINLAVDGRDRACTRLVAGLISTPFDALWQRERRRQQGRLAFSGGLLVTGLVLLSTAIVAGALALQGFDEVAEQKAQIAEVSSNIVAREAAAIFDTERGDHTASLLMALYADPAGQDPSIRSKYAKPEGFALARARLAVAYENNRLARMLKGHEGIIVSAAFSPDGRRIVTGSGDNTARIWDAETGATLLTLEGHEGPILSTSFSPDGQKIVTGSLDNSTRVWDAHSGTLIHKLTGPQGYVRYADFSEDGSMIFTGSSDNAARIWNAKTGAPARDFDFGTGTTEAALSPDSKRVVTASLDNFLQIWNAESGEVMRTLEGHQSSVYAAAFSPDGKLIASGSSDTTVRIWDVETGLEKLILQGHEASITSVSFSSDGKQIVSGSYDNTVRIWNIDTGAELRAFLVPRGPVTQAAFSPDGKKIIIASGDELARTWDIAPKTAMLTLPGSSATVAFSPENYASSSGQWIVTGYSKADAQIWNRETGAAVDLLVGHEDRVSSAAFSPDGKRIVTGSYDKTARIWNVDPSSPDFGSPLRLLVGHEDWVSSVAFSPDGKRIVTGSYDKTARIWNADPSSPDFGTPLRLLVGHEGRITSAAFSPDGKRIVTGSLDKTARIWNAELGTMTNVLKGHENEVTSVSFSPDGMHIVTGSADATLWIWDSKTGAAERSLIGHASDVNYANISPNGKWIVSAAADNTARVWDVRTGNPVLTLEGHDYWLEQAVFSPDSKQIATVSADRTARLWELSDFLLVDGPTQIKMACEMLRNANAPQAFSVADIAKYPVLQGQPIDPDNSTMLKSPCKRELPNAELAKSTPPT